MWKHQTTLITLLLVGGLRQDPCDVDLDTWLSCNNPGAIRYLGALSERDIGKVLKGVQLTDGSFVAKGYRLVALPKVPGRVHIVVVQRPYKSTAKTNTAGEWVPGVVGAFIWVDAGGEPLLLPDCPRAAFESRYGLSGDVYTWKAVQPDHGVVEVECIDPSWNPQARQ